RSSRLSRIACALTAFTAALLVAAPMASADRIAFVSDRDGNAEIYSVRPDGSDLQRVTSFPGADVDPAFSPDGRLIAFSRDMDGLGNYQLFTVRPDGTGLRRISQSPRSDRYPAWSPDGASVAFRSNRASTDRERNFDIWVAGRDGSNPTRLTNDPALDS